MVNSITRLAYNHLNSSLKNVRGFGGALGSGKAFSPGTPGNNNSLLSVGIDSRGQSSVRSTLSEGLDAIREKNVMAMAYVQASADVFNRMQEIAGEALDSSKSSSERTDLNTEFTTLKNQLSSIATSTYNGAALFGTAATGAQSQTIQIGITSTDSFNVDGVALLAWATNVGTATVSSQANAAAFLAVSDNYALSLGAFTSTLSVAVDRLDLFSDTNSSLSAQLSNVADEMLNVDVAKATAEYSANQLGSQASVSMISKGVQIDSLVNQLYQI